uniref:Uncharacterized protein n=1 Tax=Plectus sambesii TaxID=2011161 RepID=A0A914WJK3_9BILA
MSQEYVYEKKTVRKECNNPDGKETKTEDSEHSHTVHENVTKVFDTKPTATNRRPDEVERLVDREMRQIRNEMSRHQHF